MAMETGGERGEVLRAGELEIRLGEGLVRGDGRVLTLSVREYQLLVAMARRAGGILRRDELYRSVWGSDLRPGDRSVDVYVSKLRSKLEQAMPGRRFIHTHPGFGYRFQPGPSRNLDNPVAAGRHTATGERLEPARAAARRASPPASRS
jgi:DNA-binding response OmpR family regulator